jgi:hypothetical protein
MTTQQQQQPATLDPVTQERWDAWCDARIDNRIDCVAEELNGLADEIGVVTGQQANKIIEVLEIMQVLAIGNDFLRGRIDQVTREFKGQNGIEHKAISRTIERTIATRTEEERTSTVSQVVESIEEILSE